MKFLLLMALALTPFADASAEPDHDRIPTLQERLAESLFQSQSEYIVASLAEKGLDKSDGERIVREYMHHAAHCILEAIKHFTIENSLDFNEQLDNLESSLEVNTIDNYLGSFDDEEMKQISKACFELAAHVVGIEIPE